MVVSELGTSSDPRPLWSTTPHRRTAVSLYLLNFKLTNSGHSSKSPYINCSSDSHQYGRQTSHRTPHCSHLPPHLANHHPLTTSPTKLPNKPKFAGGRCDITKEAHRRIQRLVSLPKIHLRNERHETASPPTERSIWRAS